MSRNADRFHNVEYLGDGVYAGHDSYEVWVWASNGVNETPPVALEPGTLHSLIQYARHQGIYPR